MPTVCVCLVSVSVCLSAIYVKTTERFFTEILPHILTNCFPFLVLYTVYSSVLAVLYLELETENSAANKRRLID